MAKHTAMKNLFCSLFIFSFLIFADSCGHSVEDMVKDYNGGFTESSMTISSGTDEKVLEPGDAGFSQSMLLRDDYTVYSNATLNLAAPASCKSFSWILTDPKAEDNAESVPVVFFGNSYSLTKWTQKDYVFYVPNSGLECPHTYILSLTVIGKDGYEYKDSCQIYIVEHFSQ